MKKEILLMLFVFVCLNLNELYAQASVSVGVTGGRIFNWIDAPLAGSNETERAIGGYVYFAPMVYYMYSDNISFSVEPQLGLGMLEPNNLTFLGLEEETVLKSTMMLRANFFSAANTGDEEGITIGTCNTWLNCWNLGFWGGIGREWTSKVRFDNAETDSFVSYPIEIGLTFNLFHPNTAVAIFGRADFFSSNTSSNSLGVAITWNFPNSLF